ncbi:MAG TPA: TetR/AcrR family transcriptional regulator C-terminal domain-containing protein [Streptosporangiaceae bacterium]|nr:TetR/AcrR family transcriptional regulator C-terminal domain-containing protein [Streptosporangiaceae bacterium]
MLRQLSDGSLDDLRAPIPGPGSCLHEQDISSAEQSPQPPTIPGMLAELTDPRRFPALAKFLAAGVFEMEDGPDDEFIFGLDRILDGIEVLIQR